jgi:cell shape-determining protein MreC
MQSSLKQYFLSLMTVMLLFFMEFLGLLDFTWLKHQANQLKHWHYQWLLPINRSLMSVQNFWQLRAKLEDLQYRYAEAAAQLAAIDAIEKENQELRHLLENSNRDRAQVVIAAPIVSFAKSSVTVGSNQGVQVGAAVLYQDNLLGVLGEVSQRQSAVILLQNLQTGGIVAKTKQGVMGLVKGNGREIVFTEVAATAALERGELVYTAANASVEAGLVIGKIGQIRQDNVATASKIAVIEPLVNFYELAIVEIK